MAEDRLEDRLRELGPMLDAPDAEGTAEAVRRRLETERPRRRRVLTPALVAAVVVIAVGGVGFALLQIPGVDIERVTVTPTAPPRGDRAEPTELALGREVSLEEARAAVDINVLIPQRLGHPDGVYVSRQPRGGRVTLVYEPRAHLPEDPNTGVGMLVTLFRGTTSPEFVHKEVGSGTEVRPITVEGAPGMWIEGAPHTVVYQDAEGDPFPDSLRLAENVLIWQLGEITLRLESRLGLDDSLDVAGSMG